MSEMNDLMQALINLVTTLVSQLAPIVVGAIVWFVKSKYEEFLRNKPENIRDAYAEAAKIGISFAEVLAKTGHEKLIESLRVAEMTLQQQGYKNVNLDVLQGYVETQLPEITKEILQNKIQKEQLKRVLNETPNRG